MYECEYCGNELSSYSGLMSHQKKAKFCLSLRGIEIPFAKRKLTKEEYQVEAEKIAEENGGKVLDNYVRNDVKLTWMCSKEHTFTCHLYNVRRGTWCLECKRPRRTIAECHKIAENNNGKCISEKYEGTDIKLIWECHLGHTWDATYDNVVIKGSWCPICWVEKRDGAVRRMIKEQSDEKIKEAQTLAQSKGGDCLSEEYISGTAPMIWKCKNNHIWTAKWKCVISDKYGTWCPKCLSKNEEETREIFERLLGVKIIKTKGLFSKKLYELDGYSAKCGPNKDIKIGFEYQGEQHYRDIPRFKAHTLEEQQERDQLKRDECEELGINLIEVPYYVKNKEEFIRDKLEEIVEIMV